MKWETISKKDDDSIIIPMNWLLPHYYEGLNALFRIENALRVFVYAVLKKEYKDKWCDINIESDDSAQSSIGKIAKQRINQTKRFAYLGFLAHCPLMYMTSGELIKLIVSDSYWKHFKDYFPGSKEIISNKLDEIGAVRNALAHFRPIKQEDINLVKKNASQVLSGVEFCLLNLLQCEETVPTNTKEDWYEALNSIRINEHNLILTQSADENWIKVSFTHNCSIKCEKTEYPVEYRILSLNTPKILQIYPNVKSRLIYLAEGFTDVNTDDCVVSFIKPISLVFNHEVISIEYEIIKKELESLSLQISEETDMLFKDNLARGDLVAVIKKNAKYEKYSQPKFNQEGKWNFEYWKFGYDIQASDPSEYWGTIPFADNDYITSTYEFPWMPVPISEIPL